MKEPLKNISNKKTIRLTQPKTPLLLTKLKNKGKENHIKKYVTQGELITKLFNKSPQRFHTRSKIDNKPDLISVPIKRITKPKPFKLHNTKNNNQKNEFKSNAQLIEEFMGKRYGKTLIRNNEKISNKKLKFVKPVSPRLLTSKLYGKSKILSTEEREIEELKKIPKFKALPLNHKIFESGGELGVPKVEKRTLTTFEEFNLSHTNMKKNNIEENEKFTFKARKIPNFKPVKRIKSDKSLTNPEPFKLRTDIIHKKTVIELNQKLEKEKELDKKRRNFKAQPIREYVLTVTNPIEEKPLTQPKPFNLRSEDLHIKSIEEFEQRMREEEVNDYIKRNFHAREVPKEIKEEKEIELSKAERLNIRKKEIEKIENEENKIPEYDDGRPKWQD